MEVDEYVGGERTAAQQQQQQQQQQKHHHHHQQLQQPQQVPATGSNSSANIAISSPKTYAYPLLSNVHTLLPPPPCPGSTHLTRGEVTYFHYGCDGYNDNGWGCAYRSLQSLCSWVIHRRQSKKGRGRKSASMGDTTTLAVPSIVEIQSTLAHIGDKSAAFVGSREWIGALEVFFVVDTLFDVPCKILHVPQREDLKKYANVLKRYFEERGGFVMMGGDMDASAKGIAGVHISGNQAYFLIVDPHFVGVPHGGAGELIERGYVRWQHSSEFVDSSFYNLCLPQLK